MLKKFTSGVDIIKDYVGIPFVRCCEYNNFVIFVNLLKHFFAEWSYIEPGVNDFASGCINVKSYIWWLVGSFLPDTMCQSFIKVKEQQFVDALALLC